MLVIGGLCAIAFLVMKGAVRIPPLVSIFTAVLWGRVFGPLGFLLAIPIDLTIWTLLEHFHMRRREEAAVATTRSSTP